jgi:hypothetical protein
MEAVGGATPVLLVPEAMPHHKQSPWLYVGGRFRAPCALHEQLHGHPQDLRSMKESRFWPPDQVHITRAHRRCSDAKPQLQRLQQRSSPKHAQWAVAPSSGRCD